MFCAPGLLPEPQASTNWYPRLPDNLHQLPGDSATCFQWTGTIQDIPSSLKKRRGQEKMVTFGQEFGCEIRRQGKQLSTDLYRQRQRTRRKLRQEQEFQNRRGEEAHYPPQPPGIKQAMKNKLLNERQQRDDFNAKVILRDYMSHKCSDQDTMTTDEEGSDSDDEEQQTGATTDTTGVTTTCQSCSTSFKLYQDKNAVSELSKNDRLDYLSNDPLSLAEIPPSLCRNCSQCTCNRNPQNFYKK
jgi:hypothetical protein